MAAKCSKNPAVLILSSWCSNLHYLCTVCLVCNHLYCYFFLIYVIPWLTSLIVMHFWVLLTWQAYTKAKHLACKIFFKICLCILQTRSYYIDCFLKGIWHCYWEYDHLKGIPGSDLTVYDIGFQTDFKVYLQLRQTWLAFSKCPLNLISVNGYSGKSVSVLIHFLPW